ncbi:MAG: topoisomerase DNA-binding C4 zinc finger domain-containing protein [Firmicutes bacterium]|nr:topoisomerase DNA-binding C4 zinc finger domain-containing protein [Bacillota bacterium]
MRGPRACPVCGGFLVRHEGKWGAFYGCTNYQHGCRYTVKIEVN